jgi:Putative restriction endonuclease
VIVATSSDSRQIQGDRGDILTIYRDRTWEQFQHLQQGFENVRGVKLSFYHGTIEILMPGRVHELFKRIIGILLETFLLDRRVQFTPTGSMTQELAGSAAVEADESYEIDEYRLSVEVNFTSGDVSKLEKYQTLAVHEVWFWEDGSLDVYHLRPDGYEKVAHSEIPGLSGLDLGLLKECILLGESSILEAVDRLRSGIKSRADR